MRRPARPSKCGKHRRSALHPRGVVAAFAVAGFAASAALAQPVGADGRARWETGVFGGWDSGATPYVLKGPVSGDVRLEDAAALGLRLGYDPSPRWGLELDWTRAEPELSLVGPPVQTIRRLRRNVFELDANVYLGRGMVRGFLVAGLGGASTGSSFGGTNLTVGTGLGMSALLRRHLDLRIGGKVRGTYGNLGPKDKFAFCDSSGCYAYRHKWYASYGFTGGLSYAF